MSKYGFSIHQDLALALCIERFGVCPFGCVKNGAPNCDANVRGLFEGRQACEPGRLTATAAAEAERAEARGKVIYAYTYQPGPMFKAASGEWKRITALSLSTIKTLTVELTELATPEEAMALIEKSDVQMVSFALFGLPRHPVAVAHPRLGQYVRKIFKATAQQAA